MSFQLYFPSLFSLLISFPTFLPLIGTSKKSYSRSCWDSFRSFTFGFLLVNILIHGNGCRIKKSYKIGRTNIIAQWWNGFKEDPERWLDIQYSFTALFGKEDQLMFSWDTKTGIQCCLEDKTNHMTAKIEVTSNQLVKGSPEIKTNNSGEHLRSYQNYSVKTRNLWRKEFNLPIGFYPQLWT